MGIFARIKKAWYDSIIVIGEIKDSHYIPVAK